MESLMEATTTDWSRCFGFDLGQPSASLACANTGMSRELKGMRLRSAYVLNQSAGQGPVWPDDGAKYVDLWEFITGTHEHVLQI